MLILLLDMDLDPEQQFKDRSLHQRAKIKYQVGNQDRTGTYNNSYLNKKSIILLRKVQFRSLFMYLKFNHKYHRYQDITVEFHNKYRLFNSYKNCIKCRN